MCSTVVYDNEKNPLTKHPINIRERSNNRNITEHNFILDCFR